MPSSQNPRTRGIAIKTKTSSTTVGLVVSTLFLVVAGSAAMGLNLSSRGQYGGFSYATTKSPSTYDPSGCCQKDSWLIMCSDTTKSQCVGTFYAGAKCNKSTFQCEGTGVPTSSPTPTCKKSLADTKGDYSDWMSECPSSLDLTCSAAAGNAAPKDKSQYACSNPCKLYSKFEITSSGCSYWGEDGGDVALRILGYLPWGVPELVRDLTGYLYKAYCSETIHWKCDTDAGEGWEETVL